MSVNAGAYVYIQKQAEGVRCPLLPLDLVLQGKVAP